MSRYIETELKLGYNDVHVWDNIMKAQAMINVAVPGSMMEQLLDARYFDTATYGLQKARLTYRIRREGDIWVATVKGGGSSCGGLHERQEWNVIVHDNQPNIEVFAETSIWLQLKEAVDSQVLEPIIITIFERKTLDVVMPDGSQIEVAADKGEILAGNLVAPILEVELELKGGNPTALFELGAALAREYPLIPEPDSKFYRGLKLAGIADQHSKKNATLFTFIDKKMLSGEALSKIIIQLIAQFLAVQKAFLEKPQEPNNVHELRISLRRFRSVLAFVEPMIAEKQYHGYQTELRRLGQALRALREIDVAYAAWQKLIDDKLVAMDSKVWLGEVLAERRSQETEKVHAAFNAGLATPLLLDLWASITEKDWQKRPEYKIPVGDYAVSRLSSWLKVMMRQGKTVDCTVIEKMHDLRLWVKKIKYATEVFQPVLSETSQLILRLTILQENMGLINDAHSTDVLLKELLREKSSRSLYLEAGILIGWQGCEVLTMEKMMEKYWLKFYRIAKKWV